MPPLPEWTGVLSAVEKGLVLASLASIFGSILAGFVRGRLAAIRQAEAKKQVNELVSELAVDSRIKSEVEQFFQQVLSTSAAQAPVSPAEGKAALDELRQQVSDIEKRIQNHRNEIVEVSRIDPVLEATIKASIENLTKRIEFLERTRLEKWDVAIIVFQVLGGLGVISGISLAIIKYLRF